MLLSVYDLILTGDEAKYNLAVEYVKDGAALAESEISLQEVWHSRPEGPVIDGVQIWYCYGADYYFFEDVSGPQPTETEEDF